MRMDQNWTVDYEIADPGYDDPLPIRGIGYGLLFSLLFWVPVTALIFAF